MATPVGYHQSQALGVNVAAGGPELEPELEPVKGFAAVSCSASPARSTAALQKLPPAAGPRNQPPE